MSENNDSTEIQHVMPPESLPVLATGGSSNIIFNPVYFDQVQRVARMYSECDLVPAHFKDNIPNCFIALQLARRFQMDEFMVMQNVYVVHGKPALEGKLIIALANQSPIFQSRIKYEFVGVKGEDSWGCYAHATVDGEDVQGTTITMDMVRREGWLDKPLSKWKTMPEQMFKYRAAAFFIRTVAPEIMMGMQMNDEAEDSYVEIEVVDPTKPAQGSGNIKDLLAGKTEEDDPEPDGNGGGAEKPAFDKDKDFEGKADVIEAPTMGEALIAHVENFSKKNIAANVDMILESILKDPQNPFTDVDVNTLEKLLQIKADKGELFSPDSYSTYWSSESAYHAANAAEETDSKPEAGVDDPTSDNFVSPDPKELKHSLTEKRVIDTVVTLPDGFTIATLNNVLLLQFVKTDLKKLQIKVDDLILKNIVVPDINKGCFYHHAYVPETLAQQIKDKQSVENKEKEFGEKSAGTLGEDNQPPKDEPQKSGNFEDNVIQLLSFESCTAKELMAPLEKDFKQHDTKTIEGLIREMVQAGKVVYNTESGKFSLPAKEETPAEDEKVVSSPYLLMQCIAENPGKSLDDQIMFMHDKGIDLDEQGIITLAKGLFKRNFIRNDGFSTPELFPEGAGTEWLKEAAESGGTFPDKE